MPKQTIYVVGYPKSGTTYLTRLLGDILNSPTGGCMPELDHTEIATEGQDRPGDYIIRKGHFTLIEDDSPLTVPYPHKLNWQRLTNEKIVFIVRDPRDICISGAYHWRQDINTFLDRMIKGDIAKCGRWDEYVSTWLNYGIIKYEAIIKYPDNILYDILKNIDALYCYDRIEQSLERQSFQSRKSQIHLSHFDRTPQSIKVIEQELRRNNMRKGISGDWRNHFTKDMNDKIWSEFGWIMERLGYEF